MKFVLSPVTLIVATPSAPTVKLKAWAAASARPPSVAAVFTFSAPLMPSSVTSFSPAVALTVMFQPPSVSSIEVIVLLHDIGQAFRDTIKARGAGVSRRRG